MLSRRYTHVGAARVASPIIALAGVAGGILAARIIPGSPPIVANAVLWGLAGGFTGYIVFASEGPQQRPSSILQAAIADGVVAGILTALSGALIDVISASGAGSSSGGTLSLGGVVLALVLAIILGALGGAAAGALALRVGGRERFQRLPSSRRKKTKVGRGAAPRNSRSKPVRKGTKR